MMCKSPLCTSLGWGRPGRQPRSRRQPLGTEGWGGGGHLLPVGWGSTATPEEPGRCSSSGLLRREPSSPSSSHQPVTLDMASRLWGARALCTQPSICKTSNKTSCWRHRVAYPWTGAQLCSPPRAWEQFCPSGTKRGRSLHPQSTANSMCKSNPRASYPSLACSFNLTHHTGSICSSSPCEMFQHN